jgi:hypothetical protein
MRLMKHGNLWKQAYETMKHLMENMKHERMKHEHGNMKHEGMEHET